jgi:hypothetical protein
MGQAYAGTSPFTSPQGTCFGFGIHATIPLACLRGGSGPSLEIELADHNVPAGMMPLIASWIDPPAAGQPSIRLYADGDTYWLWIERGGWTRIDLAATAPPRIVLSAAGDPSAREEHLWTTPVSLCLLHRGDLTLHAAAVDVGGESIVIAAPGGTGKSTLAAAFVQAGHRLLSEDLTCVRTAQAPAAVPGPAMLRLRPDVLSHVTLPGARVIRQIRSRVTFALNQDRRGECAPVPLRAVVILDTGVEGPGEERLLPDEALRRLWPMAFRLPLHNWTAACFAQLAELVRTVPVRTFPRLRSLGELPRAVQELSA